MNDAATLVERAGEILGYDSPVAVFFIGGTRPRPRSRRLVEPGFVSVPEWRPDLVLLGEQELPRIAGAVPGEPVKMFGGVARKP